MDTLPDELLNRIFYYFVNGRRGENPRKLYRLRSINKDWKRVIDNYKDGFKKYCIDTLQTDTGIFHKCIERTIRSKTDGLYWAINNGYTPSIHNIEIMNKEITIKAFDTFNRRRKRDIFTLVDRATKTRNIHTLEWIKNNNIVIKPGMFFNIKWTDLMLFAIQNFTEQTRYLGMDRFISHICNSTVGWYGMRTEMFRILYPIIEEHYKKVIGYSSAEIKVNVYIESFNQVIANTQGLSQERYCKLFVDSLLFITKTTAATQPEEISNLMTCILIRTEKRPELFYNLADIVENKGVNRVWFTLTIKEIIYKWRHVPDDTVFEKILEIIDRYNIEVSGEFQNISIISEAIRRTVNNNIIIKLIEKGFNCGYYDIIIACHEKNNTIIKYLSDKLLVV